MKPAQAASARPSAATLAVAWSLLALAAAWTPQARAETPTLQQLMQRNNCTACHLIDKRKYGPHFTEIAARYGGDAKAVATLAAKIKAGGSGVWGEDPMPPQPQVSDKDAQTMARLILALKP
ncbi:MAG: c-type cytochrome [Betaproteobacteria bacterium]|jgi:cytochrome c|nr:c-type cytochrome [Rubrivivax sp.]